MTGYYIKTGIILSIVRRKKISTHIIRGVYLTEEQQPKVRLPRKDKNEIFGTVESMLGASRVRVRSMDGKTRMGRIPGKMKKRVWLRVGDIILIRPWSFQDEKADVVWRYLGTQAEWLRRKGYI
ncbi:MAG TPA: translation initiation factor eIF-1A [Candidatus Acidoferrum sp.]|nr:translation initiation factor eIF-1A [Candidatus Acidoferrum sp.]